MTLRIDVGTEPSAARTRGVAAASAAIRRGELIVMPTESVYGVAADPFSPRGIDALREIKGRGRSFPIGVLVGAVRTVDGLATGLGAEGRALIDAFWPGPLTLIVREQPTLAWDLGGSDGTISLRMPLHPVALEVLASTGPLAVSGGNRAGDVPPRTCDAAEASLGDEVVVYLDAGPCADEQPSTIVDITGDVPLLLREGAFDLEALRSVCPEVAASPA